MVTLALRPFEGELSVELLQGLVFGGDKSLRLSQQAVAGTSIVSGKLDHASRGKFLRGADQFVHHVWIGGAQILRVAGIADHDWLAFAAAKPESLARNKLLHLLWCGITEAKVLIANTVASA